MEGGRKGGREGRRDGGTEGGREGKEFGALWEAGEGRAAAFAILRIKLYFVTEKSSMGYLATLKFGKQNDNKPHSPCFLIVPFFNNLTTIIHMKFALSHDANLTN